MPGAPPPFLHALTERDARAFEAVTTRRVYKRGAVVFNAGDRSRSVVVIRRGWAVVEATTAQGAVMLLAVRGGGDVLGEQALIDDRPRSATISAATDLEVLAVGAAEFEQYLAGHPAAAFALLRTFSNRLRESDRRRSAAVNESVAQRLAGQLLELAGGADPRSEPPGGTRPVDLPVPLSQEQLASWIGASREAVGRALRELRERQLVSTARKRITIDDIDGLRALVG
jgi:CRP-like cAMP-binding protein